MNDDISRLLQLLPERREPEADFDARLRARLAAELRGEGGATAAATDGRPADDLEVLDLEATTARTSLSTGRRPAWLAAAGVAAAVVAAVAIFVSTRGNGDSTIAAAPDRTFVGSDLTTIDLGVGGPADPYFVAAGTQVWVLTLEGDLVRVDRTTGQAVDVGNFSEASPLAVDGEAVWIADAVDGTVRRLDPSDGSLVAVIETGIEVRPSGIRIPMPEGGSRQFALIGGIASNGESVWVGDKAGRVLVIDPDENAVAGSFAVPVRPDHVQVHGDRLLVANLTGGALAVVDADDGEIVYEAAVDDLASAALHGDALYVHDAVAGTVTRIDLRSGDARTSAPIGPVLDLIGHPVLPTGLVVSDAGVLVDTATAGASLHVLDPETLADLGTLATDPDYGEMVVGPDGTGWLVRANVHQLVRITPQPR